MSEKRAVCLNCIDGRVQLPVIDCIKKNFNTDHVDMVTEPGMDGFLADSSNSIMDIKRKISISIEANNADIIVIVGHYDCKGNPADESLHKQHIRQAVQRLKKEFNNLTVSGLWVDNTFAGNILEN